MSNTNVHTITSTLEEAGFSPFTAAIIAAQLIMGLRERPIAYLRLCAEVNLVEEGV